MNSVMLRTVMTNVMMIMIHIFLLALPFGRRTARGTRARWRHFFIEAHIV